MTVESNYVITIATLSDWLKRLALVFQPMRRKTKTNRTVYAWFFPRFERVTGNCYELRLVFRQSFENRSSINVIIIILFGTLFNFCGCCYFCCYCYNSFIPSFDVPRATSHSTSLNLKKPKKRMDLCFLFIYYSYELNLSVLTFNPLSSDALFGSSLEWVNIRLSNRELKHAMFMSHRRQPEENCFPIACASSWND